MWVCAERAHPRAHLPPSSGSWQRVDVATNSMCHTTPIHEPRMVTLPVTLGGFAVPRRQIARILASFSTRRDGRVVDGGGLENVWIGYTKTVIFSRPRAPRNLQNLARILAF